MKHEAWISDYDGTLFLGKEILPEPYRQTIQEIQKTKRFGICTGRPFVGIVPLLDPWIECDLYIVSGGAMILDGKKNILFQKQMEKKDVFGINQFLQKQEIDCVFHTPSTLSCFKPRKNFPIPYQLVSSLNEIQEPVLSISLYCEKAEIRKIILRTIQEQFSVSVFENKEYLDILAQGCSKGKAVEWIRKHFSFDKIYAIGDSYNDLPMLEGADVSFTFDRSPVLVQEKSTYVVQDFLDVLNF